MTKIKIRFYCANCGKYTEQFRLPCASEKENKKAKKTIYRKGFFCLECAEKIGLLPFCYSQQ